jgi:hypothetical protein
VIGSAKRHVSLLKQIRNLYWVKEQSSVARAHCDRVAKWRIPGTHSQKLHKSWTKWWLSVVNGKLSVVIERNPLQGAVAFLLLGVLGSIVIKAVCCKPEGRGFETR